MADLTPESAQQIGSAFVQKYYEVFDSDRDKLAAFYVPDEQSSQLTFESNFLRGQVQCVDKLKNLPFSKIQHVITTIDAQMTIDGGIMILVTGQLKTDDDPPHSFTQMFHLRHGGGSWFVLNDCFRLIIHNM